MHLDSPAGRARASPAPPGRAPGAWPPTCTGSAAARRAVCTTCACFSAGEREQTRRPHVGAGVQRPSASSLTRTLVVPGPAAVRSRGTPCRRVDALVGELEGGDITAGDRAHIAGDLLATCPAIPDRERSILEWQTGWMLFCETGGRSARGIALRLSHLRYMLHTSAWSDSSG